MSNAKTGWTLVSQIADMLQITAALFGVGAVALAAWGKNPFTDPDNTTLIVAIVAFAIVGVIAIITAVARNRQDNAGFIEGSRATSRMLYTIGVLMLALAVGIGLFLALRTLPPTVPGCPHP